jgi:hypothetical protein
VAAQPPDEPERPDDDQGIDPAAADTWIGSGAGADLLSVVAGTFLPAEEFRGFAGRISDRLEGFADEIAGRAETPAPPAQPQRGYGEPPEMTTLSLRPAQPDYKLAEGEGVVVAPGPVPSAQAGGNRDADAAGIDRVPDGDEILEAVSERVYELLMEEMEQSFESR